VTARELANQLGTTVEDVLARIEVTVLDVKRIMAEVRAGQAEVERNQADLARRMNEEADARNRALSARRIDVTHPGTFKVTRPPSSVGNEVH
jgi:hypothetical protein